MNEIIQGDLGTLLNLTITNDIGVVDLRSASSVDVTIRFKNVNTTKSATITDALNGKVQVSLDSNDTKYDGVHTIFCTVTFQDNSQFTSDSQSFNVSKNYKM